MRRLLFAFCLLASACGSKSSPTSPTPPTPPVQTTFTLSGAVVDNKVNANRVPNATVAITAGTNSGRSATSDGAGNYRLADLSAGTFTVSLTAANYISTTQSVTLGSADRTQNLFMDPVPPPIFTKSGTGANVFDMPTYVTRIRIQGSYAGSCENFIVHIAGRSVVNEILGSCSVGTGRTYDGTFVTSGGVTEVLFSNGVSWTFTEVR